MLIHDINKNNNHLNDNKKVYMALNEENDDFLEKYKKSVRKQKSEGSRATFHTTFLDLIHMYKDNKGYVVKDLSIKNNLFDQSALLLGNNKIIPYLKMVGNASTYFKDMNYLERLNEIVVEKLNNESNKTSSKKIQPKADNNNNKQFMTSTGEIVINKTQKKEISKRELISLIVENLKCIDSTNNLIESNDLRQLILNKGIISLNKISIFTQKTLKFKLNQVRRLRSTKRCIRRIQENHNRLTLQMLVLFKTDYLSIPIRN